MNLLTTKTFKLALYSRGDPASEKIAIVIPGRLDTKDYAHNTSLVDYLASLGYYALSFDPPGTWDSPGGIELFTTTNYLKVVDELIEYFGNKPTLLLGHSRGGSVAILAGARNPHVSGIVAIMASYGPPTPPSEDAKKAGFQEESRDLPPGVANTPEQRKFELPISYFVDGAKYNPAEALKSSAKPKLLIYSSNDEFTDPAKVDGLYEDFLPPKMLHKLSSKHDYRHHSAVIDDVNQVIGRFITKYL